MWTKDSRGREIKPNQTVQWSDPQHLGGTSRRGKVVEPIRGGWFRVLEEGASPEARLLLKPDRLTIQ